MARYKEPYTLYCRKTKRGIKVWYYRTYTSEGKRTAGISTGLALKADATRHCNALVSSGDLIPGPKPAKPPSEVRRSRRPPTLGEWAKERHWWEWRDSGPVCTYCVNQLARSSKGAPAIQRHRADTCAMVLKSHILPAWGAMRIDQITPGMCNTLLGDWKAKGLSAKTINDYASVGRVMFGEAVGDGIIKASPWEHVRGYYAESRPKGILSREEYDMLMHPGNRAACWPRPIYYAIHLLASVTGLRAGECLNLKAGDLFEDHVVVSGSWNIKYGSGPQKTKRGTDELPIPPNVYAVLSGFVEEAKGGYLFSLSGGVRPCTAGRSADALERALAKIGISPEERKRRRLSPHSWRAFANTYLRSMGISDAKIRKITRHETEEMTEHYTAFRSGDLADVQEALVSLAAWTGDAPPLPDLPA